MFLLYDLLFLFSSLILSFILYPFWIKFVYKYHLGEGVRGDGPQTHLIKSGTPTMGGVIFVFAVSVITFLFNRSRTQTLFPLFIASLAGLLGLLEDFTKVFRRSGFASLSSYVKYTFFKKEGSLDGIVREKTASLKAGIFSKIWGYFKEFSRIVGSREDSGIQTYQKFIFQGLIAGFVSYWTYFKLGWDFLWFPLVGNIHIGFLYPIFVFLFFMMVLNFVGFTDGVDGLAGGLAFFNILAFWILSRVFEYNSLAVFCATFVGALIPFLYWNVYPARIFMGNVGSHVLGAVLALLAVVLHREIAFLIIGFVFLFDGLSSPLQSLSVKLTKKRLFRMAPVHHHFEMLGWPETKVTMRFWLFGIMFSFLGLFIALL